MAYRFKHRQSVPQNVKRIAAEELDSAIAHLRGRRGASREDSVHEVRKSIKKTRALLRMVRPELGDLYQKENVLLRDTGRNLSELRDAEALVGTVDELRRRRNGSAPKSLLKDVRKLFVGQKRQIEEQSAARKLLPSVAAELQKARQSIRHWPLHADGFPAIAKGLEKTFRDGKAAMATARKSGRMEDFHEWRKRVKDHWYQVRLLNKLWGDVMVAYEGSLKKLEAALGEDINFRLLEEQIRQMAPQNGARARMESLQKTIRSVRQELRRGAFGIGAKVYAQKPREFRQQIKRLWKAW